MDNNMKQLQIYMRRALQSLVVLALLTTGGAWAQTQAFSVAHQSSSGCRFFMFEYPSLLERRAADFQGSCLNGSYQGGVVIGSESEVVSDRGSHFTTGNVTAGVMAGGKFVGIFMTFSSGFSSVYDAQTGRYLTQYNLNKASSPSVVMKMILDDVAAKSVAVDAATIGYLENLIDGYMKDAAGFMAQYSRGPFRRSTMPGQNIDDPKAFGRSARGG
jgi:hypothetical protein